MIGKGAKLSLARSPDGDVLKDIIIKLQKRVKTGVATLLIKVKTYRGEPLNEETDIRSEIGRLKEESEKTWNVQIDRTIYQWSETSKTKKGTLITKTSAWTYHVRNRMRQKGLKKQEKYKHLREEQKNGAGNTSNVTKRVPSPKRVKTS